MLSTTEDVLDLKQLRYYLAVARAGSIAAGSAALGVASSTISEAIAGLEGRLGVALAIRESRGLRLTQSGEALARLGPDLIEASRTLVEAVKAAASDKVGDVTIALPPTLAVLIGVPLAETARIELPQVRLRTIEGLSGDIPGWLLSGSADIGFVYSQPGTARFAARPLFREELFLVSASDFPPEKANDGDPTLFEIEDLAGMPLVMPSRRHNARCILESAARSRGTSLNVVSEMDSYTQIIEMVERASAYTVLPRAAVLAPLSRGSLLLTRLCGGTLWRTCYVVQAKARPRSAATVAVEELAKAVLGDMNARHGLSLDFDAVSDDHR